MKTREAITKFGLTVLPHPLYSPDLAPSDFHLFGALKNAVRIVNTDECCENWATDQDKEWY
jgi:hypothetical protein